MRHRHQSFNARIAKDRPELVRETLELHRGEASLLTGTEGNAWSEGMYRAEGWGFFHEPGDGNSGDPFVSWSTSVWNKRGGKVVALSQTEYDNRLPHAAVVRLRHWHTDERVLPVVFHLPAHIGRKIRTPRIDSTREKAYLESLESLRQLALDLRRYHPRGHRVFVGDWNLDFHTQGAKNLIVDAFAGTGLKMVPLPYSGGTHRGRLIDWALTDMHSSGEILTATKASDHRGVAFTHED